MNKKRSAHSTACAMVRRKKVEAKAGKKNLKKSIADKVTTKSGFEITKKPRTLSKLKKKIAIHQAERAVVAYRRGMR